MKKTTAEISIVESNIELLELLLQMHKEIKIAKFFSDETEKCLMICIAGNQALRIRLKQRQDDTDNLINNCLN
jgi:hypothetical protein